MNCQVDELGIQYGNSAVPRGVVKEEDIVIDEVIDDERFSAPTGHALSYAPT
jgi:hypothetical protein